MGDPWGIGGFRVRGAPGRENRGKKLTKISENRRNRKKLTFFF